MIHKSCIFTYHRLPFVPKVIISKDELISSYDLITLLYGREIIGVHGYPEYIRFDVATISTDPRAYILPYTEAENKYKGIENGYVGFYTSFIWKWDYKGMTRLWKYNNEFKKIINNYLDVECTTIKEAQEAFMVRKLSSRED